MSARIARPNRTSTLAVYQSKWRVFSSWCNSGKIDPLEASVPQIADFVLDKFMSGLAPSTLAGYRTAIAKTIHPHSGVDLGEDKSLTALLHNFELECPVSRNKIPDWDLSLVLNRLAPPFRAFRGCSSEALDLEYGISARLGLGQAKGRNPCLGLRKGPLEG